MDPPFSYYVDMFIAYPRTKSLDKSDFVAPTCYYTCNEKKECDMKECVEYVNKKKYPNKETERFIKLFANDLKSTHYQPYLLDGFHIQYSPEDQEKAYNLMNFVHMRPNKQETRTGVIELNNVRLHLIK